MVLIPLSFSLQIIDSIIEESQKESGVEEDLLRGEERCSPPSAEEISVLDKAQVSEPSVASVDPSVDSVSEPQLPDVRPQEEVVQHINESAPDVAGGSQDQSQAPPPPPPDITSALGPSPPEPALGHACEVESTETPKTADILEQVPLADEVTESDTSGPSKPPRQFTVEPDIVASTKKIPPSRPPPPSGAPPPRPPPPARPALPPGKKSQEVMRPTGLEGEITDHSKHLL